ncbi:MAG: hypothetical protein KIH00_09195 [Lachnospiraceae bacterium]|nr:hypothetical protein [Lachnospiraceae bacterium]
MTPQLREMIQKLESLSDNHRVNALIFRDGEAILALSVYTFSDGLPSKGKSLQRNIDLFSRQIEKKKGSIYLL